MEPPPHSPLSPGDVVLRRYRVEARVGAGVLAEVYRGTDLDTGAAVAVKALRRALAEATSVSARFLREARIARKLQHPAIPRGLAVGVAPGGAPVLVVDYVDGDSLRARLDREGPLPWRDALRVGARVAEALDAAHAAGVIHRDVKPENVMLASGLPIPEAVRVLDFGLAYVLDEPRLSATRAVVGTPSYLSPEQCRGEPVTRAADVYALGATLAHLITGATLYAGAPSAQCEAHARNALPDLRARCPSLPPAVAGYLATMLRGDPRARPVPARSVARDLEALARGEAPATEAAPVDDAPADVADAWLATARRADAARQRIVEQLVALGASRIAPGEAEPTAREEALERALADIAREADARQLDLIARLRARRGGG